jgi:hypothetical protein
MQALEERASDQGVLKLLRVMLRAGVMDDGQIRHVIPWGAFEGHTFSANPSWPSGVGGGFCGVGVSGWCGPGEGAVGVEVGLPLEVGFHSVVAPAEAGEVGLACGSAVLVGHGVVEVADVCGSGAAGESAVGVSGSDQVDQPVWWSVGVGGHGSGVAGGVGGDDA